MSTLHNVLLILARLDIVIIIVHSRRACVVCTIHQSRIIEAKRWQRTGLEIQKFETVPKGGESKLWTLSKNYANTQIIGVL